MGVTIAPAGAATIARAAALLERGELVAFPTETVYGLGADARNARAVQRIFEAKGRPADHPVIVHLAEPAHIERWAGEVPSMARRLAEAFWPGPLTLIVKRGSAVHDAVTGGQDTVGLRVPAHPVARDLLRAFGHGVAAPSANRFGRISPTTAQHVADDLGERVALIVDGGPCEVGIESTIVACIDEHPMLLRPGGISLEALASVLGTMPRRSDAHAPRASGMLASHYAPRTPARLVDAAELASVASSTRAAVLARTIAKPIPFAGTWLCAPVEPRGYAQSLYAALRTLDAAGAPAILIEAVPDDASWLAVRDRLTRATEPGMSGPIDEID